MKKKAIYFLVSLLIIVGIGGASLIVFQTISTEQQVNTEETKTSSDSNSNIIDINESNGSKFIVAEGIEVWAEKAPHSQAQVVDETLIDEDQICLGKIKRTVKVVNNSSTDFSILEEDFQLLFGEESFSASLIEKQTEGSDIEIDSPIIVPSQSSILLRFRFDVSAPGRIFGYDAEEGEKDAYRHEVIMRFKETNLNDNPKGPDYVSCVAIMREKPAVIDGTPQPKDRKE